MTPKQQGLWNKLLAFNIGNKNASLSFAQRLARENNWTLAYSERVIVEYKKFLFLTVITNESQSPSDQVDQAWHLHMTYTRSYWIELCQELLNHEIHHCPTEGGTQEQQKYHQLYRNTLLNYEQYFGALPEDIWPDVEKRFTDAHQFIRINKTSYWLIPRWHLLTPKWLAVGMIPALLAACSGAAGDSPNNLSLFIGIGVLIVLIIALRTGGSNRKAHRIGKRNRKPSRYRSTDSGGSSGGYGDSGCKSDSSSDSGGSSGCSSGCGSGCGGS